MLGPQSGQFLSRHFMLWLRLPSGFGDRVSSAASASATFKLLRSFSCVAAKCLCPPPRARKRRGYTAVNTLIRSSESKDESMAISRFCGRKVRAFRSALIEHSLSSNKITRRKSYRLTRKRIFQPFTYFREPEMWKRSTKI